MGEQVVPGLAFDRGKLISVTSSSVGEPIEYAGETTNAWAFRLLNKPGKVLYIPKKGNKMDAQGFVVCSQRTLSWALANVKDA